MTKKKSIRVGQRSAVRKLIRKIEDELEKENDMDIERRSVIESLCETLRKKREMLAEINKEILEETEEENMESEIEDCDRYDIDIEFILTKVRNKFENSKTNLNVTYIDHNPNANELAYGNSAPNLMQMRQSPNYSNQKLPKLSLPYFDGNLLEWQTFWESFESSVHDN